MKSAKIFIAMLAFLNVMPLPAQAFENMLEPSNSSSTHRSPSHGWGRWTNDGGARFHTQRPGWYEPEYCQTNEGGARACIHAVWSRDDDPIKDAHLSIDGRMSNVQVDCNVFPSYQDSTSILWRVCNEWSPE